jgi:hypothetical protein
LFGKDIDRFFGDEGEWVEGSSRDLHVSTL